MAFEERFRFVVDLVTKGAATELDGLGRKAKQTGSDVRQSFTGVQGAVVEAARKIPGVGKAFDAVGSAAGGALGTIGEASIYAAPVIALGKAAYAAATQFSDGARKVEDFSTKSGLAADQASRWVAVADDAGVSLDDLSGAFGKLAVNVGKTPAALDKVGVAVAHNKDGAVDLNQTFLNVVDAYGATDDASRKAAIAQAGFGKQWQGLVRLLDQGSSSINQSLASVDTGQLFTTDDFRRADNFYAAIDNLQDSMAGLNRVFGEISSGPIAEVAGELNDLATAADKVAQPLGGLSDVLGKVVRYNPLNPLGTVHALTDAWGLFGHHAKAQAANVNAANKAVEDSAKANKDAKAATAAQADATKSAAEAAKGVDDATRRMNATLAAAAKAAEDHAKALRDEAKALNDEVDAAKSAADANETLAGATDDYAQTLDDLHGNIADINKSTDDAATKQRKLNGLYREGVDKAKAVADAAVTLKTNQDLANGSTTTAATKLATWNSNMVNAAAYATGPLRSAILGYIGNVNGIPAAKLTEIQALIDAGKLDAAKTALANASKARTVALKADADTAQADKDLDYAARDRYLSLVAKYVPPGIPVGPPPGGMAGIASTRPGPTMVGEAGPELVWMPGGARVETAGRTRMMTRGAGAGSTVIIVNMPAGSRPDDVVRAQRRWAARNGPT